MKTIVLGDTHGRSNWKLAIHQDKPDRVIFIGDYFDSFEISGVEQIANFKEIIKYKETNPQVEVVMLIGNHDHHYFPEVGYTGTSGYQSRIAPSITQIIDENRYHLQMAYGFGDYLFTHAGVSPVFMDQVFGENDWSIENVVVDLNEMFRYKPKIFDFNGFESSGDNTTQTPIWIRPRSLVSANKKHPKGLKKDYIQVVGHTAMRKIDLKDSRYYFIDTMDTSGEYLVIQDNQITINSVR
jgi:predicted MPP superfamily phosphohydrolase